MKVLYETTTNELTTNITDQAQYHKSNKLPPRSKLLQVTIGSSFAFVAIAVVILTAVLCIRRQRRRKLSHQTHHNLVGSPSSEDTDYEIIERTVGISGVPFSMKADNNVSQLGLGQYGNVQLFASSSNIVISLKTTSAPTIIHVSNDGYTKVQARNATSIREELHVSNDGYTKVQARNATSIREELHNIGKLTNCQIRKPENLESVSETLTNKSPFNNDYVNFSGEHSDDTKIYLETTERQEELYANNENIVDVIVAAARQPADCAQEYVHTGMEMNSENRQIVSVERQSRGVCGNLDECSQDIYVNNSSFFKPDSNTTQHGIPENQEYADELYLNFKDIDSTNNENSTTTGRNHCTENIENVSMSEALKSHHRESNGTAPTPSSTPPTISRKYNGYQNVPIDQSYSLDMDIPKTDYCVMSVVEETGACEYSTTEYVRELQTQCEDVATNHYSSLGQDVSCVVNVYDSFS